MSRLAANVLIHEEGRLELCDFGVANVLDTRTDKRRTFIGTLHWMPPELWSEKPEYSDEVGSSNRAFESCTKLNSCRSTSGNMDALSMNALLDDHQIATCASDNS